MTSSGFALRMIVEMSVHHAKGNGGKDEGKVAKAVNGTIAEELFGIQESMVEAAMDSFACKYMQEYVKAMKPLYANDRNDAARHAWYEYRYSIKTEIRTERRNVDTYVINTSYYEGGAHGIEHLNALYHVVNIEASVFCNLTSFFDISDTVLI